MREWIVKYWAEALFGAIIFILTAKYKNLKNKAGEAQKEQDALKNGVKALLRDRIVQAYNHYTDKEYIPIYGLENVNALYEEYHCLGGNGTITSLVEELRELPKQPNKA